MRCRQCAQCSAGFIRHLPVIAGVLLGWRGMCAPLSAQLITPPPAERLERIRRETQEQITEQVPLDRRALLDYGAYATAAYMSIDDAQGNNRALRRYDLVTFERVWLECAQQFD